MYSRAGKLLTWRPRVGSCWTIAFLVYVAALTVDAFWIYYLVLAQADPLVRAQVARSDRSWDAFETCNHLSGFFLGIANLFVAVSYYVWICETMKPWRPGWRFIAEVAHIIIVLPIAVCFVTAPFFSDFVLESQVTKIVWKHRCDGYPMTVMLTGRLWNDPATKPISAEFYLDGSQQSVFTYEAVQSNSSWAIGLRSWGVDDPNTIPSYAYPTLRNITLDLATHEMNGTCTVTTSPTSNATTMLPCMQGSFTDSIPPVHLSSSIPLITQSGISIPPNTTTTLDAKGSEIVWAYKEPYVILRLVDNNTQNLGPVVLRTGRQDPKHCDRLRVCVAGVDKGGTAELVGAEVLAPLGLMLANHALYAAWCSYRDSTVYLQ